MSDSRVDWNRVFEFAWRILIFIVAIGIIMLLISVLVSVILFRRIKKVQIS